MGSNPVSPLPLLTVSELIEIRVEVCRRAQQGRRQLFAEPGCDGHEFIVVPSHTVTQWLRVGDRDVSEFA